MFVLLSLIAAGFTAIAAVPTNNVQIVGGNTTTIDKYPFAAALLYSYNGRFQQYCGGTILNTRAILSAGHCVGHVASNFRVRVGSSRANSGGIVHSIASMTVHPSHNRKTNDNDVAILRTVDNIVYTPGAVQWASIAPTNYDLADNQAVFAIGWGRTSAEGPPSEDLRHVQIWTINQLTCRSRYAELNLSVTDNMLCSGWLDHGGRDQCYGDSGGPLVHKGVVVGVCSWGHGCAQAHYPGINTRVSRFSNWIKNNS